MLNNANTFFSRPVNEMVDTPLDSFSGIFSSSIIPDACSMQLLDLQLSESTLRSRIRACEKSSKLATNQKLYAISKGQR